jgi:hypothetical protein
MCDFRTRLLLASPPTVFKGDDAENARRVLDGQIRKECRTGRPQSAGAPGDGLEGSYSVGVPVQEAGETQEAIEAILREMTRIIYPPP